MGSYFAFNKQTGEVMINKEKYIFEYQNNDKIYCTNIYAYNLVEAEEAFKNKYKNCLYMSDKTPLSGQSIYYLHGE